MPTIILAEFILKNNYFESDWNVKLTDLSDIVTRTKFAVPNLNIFMDKGESEFLKVEDIKLKVWVRYVEDIFFI